MPTEKIAKITETRDACCAQRNWFPAMLPILHTFPSRVNDVADRQSRAAYEKYDIPTPSTHVEATNMQDRPEKVTVAFLYSLYARGLRKTAAIVFVYTTFVHVFNFRSEITCLMYIWSKQNAMYQHITPYVT